MKSSALLPVAIIALAVAFGGCSRKGSSSISSGHKSTTSKVSPKVRVQQDTEAARQASLKAAQEAEEAAKAAAEKAAKEAQAAKEAAEAAAKAAAEKAVVVKEEKVKIIETKAETTDENNRYHIIIGSFKQLANARSQCQDAISKNFYPSIMENEEGMYRVAICSYVSEAAARTKIAELRKKYTEYVGMWLLIQKK